jgi:hypothetical protein
MFNVFLRNNMEISYPVVLSFYVYIHVLYNWPHDDLH